MNKSDILEVIRLLEHAYKLECWDSVEEAINYMKEYTEEDGLFIDE